MEGASGYLGPIVMVGLALIGGLIGYVTLRAMFNAFVSESGRRFAESEADRKELRSKIEVLGRRVDDEFVKRGDLISVKSEIIERIKDVEHAMRNDTAKALVDMREMMKSVLDRFLEKRS